MTRDSTPTSAAVRYMPLAAAAFAIVAGAGTLWARAGDIPTPLAWLLGMQSSAAAAFVWAGAALALAWLRSSSGALRIVRLFFESALLLFAILALLEHMLGTSFGIGRLLAPDTSAAETPPVAAASGFLLAAAALLLEHRARARGAARALGTVVGVLGLVTLVGYLYSVPLLYRPFDGAAMSVPSAAVFTLFGAGLVALHPERGLTGLAIQPTVLGAHLRWLFPAAIVIPLLIGGLAVRTYEATGIARLGIAVSAAGTMVGIGIVIGVAALILRRMESRLAIANRALSGAGEGVLIADARAGAPIIYVNDAFTEISGYPAREAIGRPCNFFAAGVEQDAEELAALKSALATGTRCTAIFQARRRDGAAFSCRLSVSAVAGSDGSVDHLIGLLEDVTAEQLAAKARLELLAEASQARKDAEAASQARDILLASVTHDLRSPLNACLMWADVMALSPMSEKATKAIDAIKRNLKLQARLVDDLIDTAKISSGGIEIHAEQTDLAAVVGANLETWKLLAQNKGVQFTHEVPPGDYTLVVDPERTLQVLNNLLDNAFGSVPEGGHVQLRLSQDAKAVEMSIADDGSGLSGSELGMLFKPFWRGKNFDRKNKGLGLGLAIAEHLVKRHDGTLTVASDGPGQGCRFTVRLPRSASVRSGDGARTTAHSS